MRSVPEGEVNPYENQRVVEIFDVSRSTGGWRSIGSRPEFYPLIIRMDLIEAASERDGGVGRADLLSADGASNQAATGKPTGKGKAKPKAPTTPLDRTLNAPTTLQLEMANDRDGQKVLKMLRAQKTAIFGDSRVAIRHACFPTIRIVFSTDPTLTQGFAPYPSRDLDPRPDLDPALAPDAVDASQLLSGLASLWARDYLAEATPITVSQDGLVGVDLVFSQSDGHAQDLLEVLEDINQSVAAANYSMVAFLIPAEAVQEAIAASTRNTSRATTPKNTRTPTS
eukprot:TRINITY_DN7679_c0_g1_i1.p1 TRINITY_DN7679_c0_g1~~TRINITY_DN7679_c0_g1_i1.p1  ORF type:complete len:283 (-),score=65.69 TRINITY_DN7679_c0_g1_i1:443-1291(-)